MKHYFSLLTLALLGGVFFLPMLITLVFFPMFLFGGIGFSLLFDKIKLIDVKRNTNIVAFTYTILPMLIFSYFVVKKYMTGAEINNMGIIIIISTILLLFITYYLIKIIINNFIEKR